MLKQKDTGEVPMHIRNAPIEKMKELGYHEGYLYPHDFRTLCRATISSR